MNKNVLIAGGTGFVGKAISKLLTEKGYNVALLSRTKSDKKNTYFWDYQTGIIEPESIEFADIIINLAGENISGKRWSKKQKQKIVESRVLTTNLLFEQTKKSIKKPVCYISASAVGYYGNTNSDKIFIEDDKPGNDFLANTVYEWEKSADNFKTINIRTVKLRLGVVLSEKEGALPKMIIPVKLGIGSPIGSGKQFMPWIEINDLARMFLFVIENENLNSVYNAVSPQQINNRDFMKSLAKELKKPFFFPKIPSFIMKLFFGEMSQILLTGNKISSEKIQKEGFVFNCNDVNYVLKNSKFIR